MERNHDVPWIALHKRCSLVSFKIAETAGPEIHKLSKDPAQKELHPARPTAMSLFQLPRWWKQCRLGPTQWTNVQHSYWARQADSQVASPNKFRANNTSLQGFKTVQLEACSSRHGQLRQRAYSRSWHLCTLFSKPNPCVKSDPKDLSFSYAVTPLYSGHSDSQQPLTRCILWQVSKVGQVSSPCSDVQM